MIRGQSLLPFFFLSRRACCIRLSQDKDQEVDFRFRETTNTKESGLHTAVTYMLIFYLHPLKGLLLSAAAIIPPTRKIGDRLVFFKVATKQHLVWNTSTV